jgi:hypothetical protein
MGSIMVVKKALYGLKSSGAAFRAHLAETFHDLGYLPLKGDPDVLTRPAVKLDGFEYNEMILVYVDDISLYFSTAQGDYERDTVDRQIDFKLKDDQVEKPENYLGAQVKQKIVRGVECWGHDFRAVVYQGGHCQRRI